MKEFAEKFYAGKAWKKARRGYIAMRINVDGGRCEECREKQGYIVHHVVALTTQNIEDASVALSWDNFKYVCKDCHDRYEGHGLHNQRDQVLVVFDENGEPMRRLGPPV